MSGRSWKLLLAVVLALACAGIADAAQSEALASPRRDGWFSVGGYQVRSDDLWVVGTAVLCSVACGVLGCFLVLRRMSLLGDAISHAILPGLALAFLLTQSRAPLPMLAGAMVVGVATAYLSAGLNKWGRVSEDSAMGVVFTSLFAIGVVMITWVARDVDLDPGCVLYGLIEFTPFDTITLGGAEIPRAFVWLGLILSVNLAMITVFFKELKIVCFDPYLAATMGISVTLVHYGLMTAVAATAVASFESVGSILVVAMLVAPGATAHLLTDRLTRMLWIAGLVAALSAIAGYVLAVWVDTSVAGMIATVSLGLFIAAALLAPRHGYLTKQARQLALSLRIAQEDALCALYRRQEQAQGGEAFQAAPMSDRDLAAATHSGWIGRAAIWLLVRRGHIVRGKVGFIATPEGLARAGQVVRGHRLWETFLSEQLSLPVDRLHTGAHRAEHFLTSEIQAGLDRDGTVQTDPHGKPIPPAT